MFTYDRIHFLYKILYAKSLSVEFRGFVLIALLLTLFRWFVLRLLRLRRFVFTLEAAKLRRVSCGTNFAGLF